MNPITNLYQNQNKVIVSTGYDSITTNIELANGHGTILPDPLKIGSYDLLWWNASDYLSPTDDPSVEIVKCIAKNDDSLVIMRSQQQTLASHKNIPNKLYNMALLPDNNLEALSYYNIPQIHGISRHTGTIGTEANITFATTGGHAHTGLDSTKIDHTNLLNKGTNTHTEIDTALSASNGHIAANGTSVHGLGTMSTQSAGSVTITGGSITGITDLTVSDGGTGRGDATAYTPICGGTTSTGVHQSVASTGTSGQVLTSNGAGALPSFQTPSAGGGWTATTKVYTDSPFTAASDNTILCNASGGIITINLPAAASNANKVYNIKKIDSSGNSITIDANASETIDGTLTKSLNLQYESITVQCDGSNWYIL